MATFDFQSVIQYERVGASINFKNSGNFSTQSATLDDGDADVTFESGDTFTFLVTADIAGDFPDYSEGDNVTLIYVGHYTTGGFTSIVLAEVGNPNFGFFFSPEDAATTNAALDNVINVTDPEFDGGDLIVCFAAGTEIATPDGTCPVERLAIGDQVLTADGRAVPVRWVGRQTVSKIFTPPDRFCPVRVQAGALGDNIPSRDLVLTGDHAILFGGYAINASAMINGHSIDWVPMRDLDDQVTYFHVETDQHDIIMANGAPVESYVDYVTRRKFDNYAEYLARYGEDRTIAEMTVPRISAARLLPAPIRATLGMIATA